MALPKDRVVFVTGASAGIGHATAKAFLADGARVAACARREIAGLDGALCLRCDVGRPDEVRHAVAAVVEKFGALHVLVNNAGFGIYGTVEDIPEEDLEAIFRTNVYGAIHCVRSALPHLRKTQGQVINVSSSLARGTIPYMVAYCMTKHALHSLSEGLRLELQDDGIAVIEVGPGLTATDFQKAAKLIGVERPVATANERGWPAERVARAILKASKRGSREVWLTADAKLFHFMHDNLPRLTDWGVRQWSRRSRP
jgi:NAD(P)-dependent dehydrogenase (short-subunit alcohol dehydrogenase family)